MRTIIAAILLLSYAAAAEAQKGPEGGVACKANQAGKLLMTIAEYTNGYKVEAPWRVLNTQAVQRGATRVTATLDHIIETDPVSGKKKLTPLPGEIEMTFDGESSGLMLEHAADIWCATVSKAIAARPIETSSRVAHNRVIM
jgi:hypothetical protein